MTTIATPAKEWKAILINENVFFRSRSFKSFIADTDFCLLCTMKPLAPLQPTDLTLSMSFNHTIHWNKKLRSRFAAFIPLRLTSFQAINCIGNRKNQLSQMQRGNTMWLLQLYVCWPFTFELITITSVNEQSSSKFQCGFHFTKMSIVISL